MNLRERASDEPDESQEHELDDQDEYSIESMAEAEQEEHWRRNGYE